MVTDGLASDSALEQTAFILDSMMATMADYIPDKMVELGFRQAVMGLFPSETVTDLPEYAHLDPEFWRERRGCGASLGSPVGCNAEEDVLCTDDDLYPDMDITVHEFASLSSLAGVQPTVARVPAGPGFLLSQCLLQQFVGMGICWVLCNEQLRQLERPY